jgi:hypothetical protein
MLDDFGDTLKQTSKSGKVYMTSSKKKVVNFDKFKESITKKYALSDGPNSCDVLYMQSENEWYLIEFKSGKIDKEIIFQVRGKIFQSLLLLTEKLDKTICFTRENLNFILVYNEKISRIDIGKSLSQLANSEFFPFKLMGLRKLYFKEVHVWTEKEFDSNFVEKYC